MIPYSDTHPMLGARAQPTTFPLFNVAEGAKKLDTTRVPAAPIPLAHSQTQVSAVPLSRYSGRGRGSGDANGVVTQ